MHYFEIKLYELTLLYFCNFFFSFEKSQLPGRKIVIKSDGQKRTGENRNTPGCFRHHHPPIIRHRRRNCAEHENQPPRHVSFLRRVIIHRLRRRIECRTNRHRHRRADENPEPLHRENGGDERSTRRLVGELRHDRRRQRIIAADSDPEHEPEESERRQHAVPSPADGESASERAHHHEDQGEAVHAPPTDPVAEVAEDDLTDHSTEQRES